MLFKRKRMCSSLENPFCSIYKGSNEYSYRYYNYVIKSITPTYTLTSDRQIKICINQTNPPCLLKQITGNVIFVLSFKVSRVLRVENLIFNYL